MKHTPGYIAPVAGAVVLLMMAALAGFTCPLRLYVDVLFLVGALFFALGAWAAAGLSGATIIVKRLGYGSEEHAKVNAKA